MQTTVLSADYADRVSIKKTHYHDSHQLIFVTNGTACMQVNKAVYNVSAGDLVIISRLEHHALSWQSLDYQRYVLELSPDIPTASWDSYRMFAVLFNRPEGFCNVLHVEKAGFSVIFESIAKELRKKDAMYPQMLDCLVQQLLIRIYRQSPDVFQPMEQESVELIYRIQTRFHRDFQKQYQLAELAEEYGLSVSYLSHLFKMITGSPVMGYLQSCRIAEAKRCLVQTNMRISEIVEHCGFTDNSNFSRTFRMLTGVSPSAFREKHNSSFLG